MLVLCPHFYNYVLHIVSGAAVLTFIASYYSVGLDQFYRVLEGSNPGPISIDIGPEKIEKLQLVKRNLHRKFWDKRNSVAKFCANDPPEMML